ncbi:MAG: T9SS type A sorting domain-containing protein [Ignavibacteria bacterium]|nr:T9SS type A sorting domain-containing protein [Ignavibacteria bacterium]
MLKKTTYLFVLLFVTASMSLAQWKYEGPWPSDLRKGGTHGIEVTPDGKIWQASYYKSTWITPGGRKLTNVSPILVFSPDGLTCDSIFSVTTGSITDTLGMGSGTSGCRGLGQDGDGNIYFISTGKIIKIDYKTYKGLARNTTVGTDVGSSPAGPAVSTDGTVFVGPVVGGGTSKIVMYDKNLTLLGTAVTGPPAIARTMKVSKDGNTIYWTPFTGTHGVFVYKRPDEFGTFTLSDSLMKGMSVESAAWNPATGLFWVSNDKRSETLAPGKYGHLRWYGVNVTTKQVVDSFTLASPITPAAADELPRGICFSKDGKTVYVGLFGTAFDRLFKFTKTGSGIEKLDEIPTGYELSQNYPNPFNPTTNIKFSIPEQGFVSVKVYNTLGQEVATLVNEVKSSGSYQVDFNASNLSSGIYMYTLRTEKMSLTKKMLLVK